MSRLTRIKTKIVCDVQTDSSNDLTLMLDSGMTDRGIDDRYFLSVMNKDKKVELFYVEISEDLYKQMKRELEEGDE